MDEQKPEETPEVPEPILENQEKPEEVTPVEEKPEDAEYERKLEALKKSAEPKRTELEKALYTKEQIEKRIVELGGQVQGDYVTRQELEGLRNEIEVRKLARSEGEAKLILAYIERGLSIEDAHLLANKSKIKSTISELQRSSEAKPGEGSGAGQKSSSQRTPPWTGRDEFLRAGGVYNPKTGTYQGQVRAGQRNEWFYSGSEWVSRKISASN